MSKYSADRVACSNEPQEKPGARENIDALILKARSRRSSGALRHTKWEDRFLMLFPDRAYQLNYHEGQVRARKALNQNESRARRQAKVAGGKKETESAGFAEVEAVLTAMDNETYPKFDLHAHFAREMAAYDRWLTTNSADARARQLRKRRRVVLSARLLLLNCRLQHAGRDPSRSEFAELLSAKIEPTSNDAARRRLKVLHDLEQSGGPWRRDTSQRFSPTVITLQEEDDQKSGKLPFAPHKGD